MNKKTEREIKRLKKQLINLRREYNNALAPFRSAGTALAEYMCSVDVTSIKFRFNAILDRLVEIDPEITPERAAKWKYDIPGTGNG